MAAWETLLPGLLITPRTVCKAHDRVLYLDLLLFRTHSFTNASLSTSDSDNDDSGRKATSSHRRNDPAPSTLGHARSSLRIAPQRRNNVVVLIPCPFARGQRPPASDSPVTVTICAASVRVLRALCCWIKTTRTTKTCAVNATTDAHCATLKPLPIQSHTDPLTLGESSH